jgi:hypothetical protein
MPFFLEWLDLTDQQAVLTREALADPDKRSQIVLDFHRRFYSIAARMELLASDRVQEKVTDHFTAIGKATQKATESGVPSNLDEFFQQLRRLPERQELIAAMRKDISMGWPRRRV